MRRLAAVLFFAVMTFGLVTASAEAAPSKNLAATDAALWTKVLQTPSAQNSFGSGGPSFGCWRLDGTVAPLAPSGVASCKLTRGDKLFAAGSTAECSTFNGDCGNGDTTYRMLKQDAFSADEAQIGGPGAPAPTITLDGANVPLTEVYTGLLQIVLPANNIFGLPARSRGQSVAHGWVALLHPLTPGTHTIVIHSNAGTVTTKISVVPPGK